ncbi:hypothetical protein FDP41_000914 [Naegleria fowleri]|uniref:SAP domain-containing protein n=1 Tax=Naegleria fowleri TaxID=5763 RepID=A0A6A5BZ03_NAEFO|nr:uncharacterized protein FDP41_000914 [Naegleria fowleri]KAF0979761.1 hypothetical protein FDP41_000914 [Naegleria fowleri]
MEFGEETMNTEDHGLFEVIRPESPSENAAGQLFHPLNTSRNPFEPLHHHDVVMTENSNGFPPHPSTSSQHEDKQEHHKDHSFSGHSNPEELSELQVTNLQELQPIGKITNVVEKKVIIEVFVDKKNGSTMHQHVVSQNDTNLKEKNIIDSDLLRTQLKLNIGAVLFSKDGKAIGKIAEVIGNVYAPYFVLVYPDVHTMRKVFNLPNPPSVPTTTSHHTDQPPAVKEASSEVSQSFTPSTTSTPANEDLEATTPTKKTPSRKTPRKTQTPKKTPSKQFVEDDLVIENVRDMTVLQLKPYLQRRGMTVHGKKKELIAKLRKYEREKQQYREEANNVSSSDDDDDMSTSSDDEEILSTPTSSQKFALRSKKDLEGMESDEEEDEHPKQDKPQSASLDKLSPDEISQIKNNFSVVYCHGAISAPLDEVSTMNIVSNHLKSYDAMLNADEKTEIVTFSDDEDENAFKSRAKKERPEKPPALKRGHDQVSTTEETKIAELTPKKQKPLPFADLACEDTAAIVATSSTIITSTVVSTSTLKSEEILPSDIQTPREAVPVEQAVIEVPPSTVDSTRIPIVRKARKSSPRKSLPSSSSSPTPSLRTDNTRVMADTKPEPESFFSKWCSIM